MPATLKEVAAQAGVSVKTVSNVVNGRLARVSLETANRVRAALESLNYQPNLAARYLRNGRAGVLAMAIPNLTNPYFASLSTAVIGAAAGYGYTVLIDHTGGDWEQESLALVGLSSHLIDGVILSPLALRMDDMQPRDTAVPVVLLGERLYEAPYDHVAIDNIAAARMATAHLLRLGRRRIAAIGAPRNPQDVTASMRLRGYEEALDEAGHPTNRDLIILTLPAQLSFTREDGARAMRQLLALDDPPDAVFCFNDLLALGAIKTLQVAGYRIPEDVAVVGIDNIEDGRFATPSLTTIAPNEQDIAHSAVSMLVERIRSTETAQPRLVQPPFRLVVRGSTSGHEYEVDR
jgi:DNA-binding LacI/PurR family transcriptional regulator